jgi:hypothetical protein
MFGNLVLLFIEYECELVPCELNDLLLLACIIVLLLLVILLWLAERNSGVGT